MKSILKAGTLAVTAAITASGFVVSCGGNSDSESAPTPTATATTIDAASATKAVAAMSALVPVCSTNSAKLAAPVMPVTLNSVWLAKKLALSPNPGGKLLSVSTLASTRPADALGSCGGRMTYPAFSHASGVTTATLSFDNYCTLDSGTNQRAVINGNIAFIDTGTPSDSGPIRTHIEANSPEGLTFVTQDTTGQQISASTLTFTQFTYTVGVPGGNPTAVNPDRFSIAEFKTKDQITGTTYRETNFSMIRFKTTSGGEQLAIQGRGYRSSGEYFDVTTSTPLILDTSGNPSGGAVTFTGANGSVAIATLLPGAVRQAMVTVNGTPLAGMPACK